MIFGIAAGFSYGLKIQSPPGSDPHQTFLLEIYDQVKANYWGDLTDEQLTNSFRLAAEKLTGKKQTLKTPNRRGLQSMLEDIIAPLPPDQKKEIAINIGDIVLANLTPFGRSRLYTSKKEQALQDTISNVDQNTDLYQVLGVSTSADQNEITRAYEEKKSEYAANDSSEAKEKMATLSRAYEALGNEFSKQRYDQVKAEPTVVSRLLTPDIIYLQIKKIAPATPAEFKKWADDLNNKPPPTSLIIDLRNNLGGDLDTLPIFTGFWLGQNQYAFELFKQGEAKPIKTTTASLPALLDFKKNVVLINNETKSSAEVLAATLKKYNLAVIVGDKTKGWGTVESFYQLKTQFNQDETYSILMVHSVTLRDDGQPIESRGVEPDIKITDTNWEKKLLEYYNYQPLIDAVKQVIN